MASGSKSSQELSENMSEPLVSVIIPTYNRAHVLERSIRSALDQSYRHIEVIVVDDASTDNTRNVVEGIDDKRVKYLSHKENLRAVAARNTGILTARGKYIAFLDSDDEWLPGKLDKQMSVFLSSAPDVGVVYTGWWAVENGQKNYSPAFKKAKELIGNIQFEGNIHNSLLRTNFITFSAALVRRDCFNKVGLLDEVPRLQDWILWLKISKFYKFRRINEPLLNSYSQPDSITKNQRAFVEAKQYFLRNYFNEISAGKNLLSWHYYDIGFSLYRNKQFRKARCYLTKAFFVPPTDLKMIFWILRLYSLSWSNSVLI